MGIKQGNQHDFSNDNTLLLSAHDLNSQLTSHYLLQDDPPLPSCIATLGGHTAFVSSLAVAGKLLYSGSFDNEVRSWTRNPDTTPVQDDHYSTNNNVVAVGKGAVKSMIIMSNKLFTAHQDHKIRVWKIGNQGEETSHEKYARIATLPTLGDRALRLLAPRNHVQVRRHKTSTWVHHVDTVSALALSEDESLLYSASWDRTIKVWQVSGFQCLESVKNAHDDAINTLALSRDGCVFTGSADKKIKLWKKAVGEKKHTLETTLEEHNSGINALVLNGKGSVLYSGASDGSVMVWERDGYGNMVALQRLRAHNNSVLCLTMVADVVCSGSADWTVRVWRKTGGVHTCLAVLEGHKGPVKCLTAATDHYSTSNNTSSCSPYLIYSGSLDCKIKVWRINV